MFIPVRAGGHHLLDDRARGNGFPEQEYEPGAWTAPEVEDLVPELKPGRTFFYADDVRVVVDGDSRAGSESE